VEAAKVVIVTPALGHGETIVRPRPDPSSISTSVMPAAAAAPARIGPQLIAEAVDSGAEDAGEVAMPCAASVSSGTKVMSSS
jgi:hypothetical protein